MQIVTGTQVLTAADRAYLQRLKKTAAFDEWRQRLNPNDRLPRGPYFKGKKGARPMFVMDEFPKLSIEAMNIGHCGTYLSPSQSAASFRRLKSMVDQSPTDTKFRVVEDVSQLVVLERDAKAIRANCHVQIPLGDKGPRE